MIPSDISDTVVDAKVDAVTESLTTTAPSVGGTDVCARCLRAPSHPQRLAEGGLRLAGKYKQSLAGQPLVSVITVVRNGAATLEQCMLSVLTQSYANLEYIVIDGASTDGTRALIERHGQALSYYVSEPDHGIYHAMNKGLALARGDYVLLLNADDWYRGDAVAKLVAAARAGDVDVAHADAALIDRRGRPYATLRAWLHDGLYTAGCPLRHETMLVRRAAYERVGPYDESYAIIADFLFVIALYDAGCSFRHVPEPLLNFRMSGISNVERTKLEGERARMLRQRFPFLDDADVALLNNPGITSDERLGLIAKHRTRSECFTRSLAYNIALAPDHLHADRLVRRVRRLKQAAWWPWSAPLRRLLNRLLG